MADSDQFDLDAALEADGGDGFATEDGNVWQAGEAPRFALAGNNAEPRWGLFQAAAMLADEDTPVASLDLGEAPEDVLADLHGVAYQYEPVAGEECADGERLKFVAKLLGTDAVQAMRTYTVLEAEAATLAATAFAAEYAEFIKELKKKKEKEDREDNDDGPPSPEKQAQRDEEADALARRRAVRAAKKAGEEVKDRFEAGQAFGVDEGTEGKLDPKEAAELYRRIKNSPDLKKLVEWAGRFRLASASAQRLKVRHGQDEVVGITVGGDVKYLLDSELVQLLDDDDLISLPALDRLLRKQCLQREWQGTEKKKDGPVMILIDESGSMQGDKIIMAKALALAVCHNARKRRRWVGLVAWSYRNQRRTLVLPPGGWNTGALLDWLQGFLNGGTAFPIDVLPELWKQMGAPEGKTDVLTVTDGEVEPFTDSQVTDFKEWKALSKARLLTVGVGSDGGQYMKSISDEVRVVRDLSLGSEGVNEALSV